MLSPVSHPNRIARSGAIIVVTDPSFVVVNFSLSTTYAVLFSYFVTVI